MPVVLGPETSPQSLGEKPADASQLTAMLALYPMGGMTCRPPSMRISSSTMPAPNPLCGPDPPRPFWQNFTIRLIQYTSRIRKKSTFCRYWGYNGRPVARRGGRPIRRARHCELRGARSEGSSVARDPADRGRGAGDAVGGIRGALGQVCLAVDPAERVLRALLLEALKSGLRGSCPAALGAV
jgi:hypothetical protein